MGHLIKQKIKSQRGISIVMALVFLLVSSAVGAVILAASSANAGHIQSSWAEQKEYFAVASAVKLLKEDFKDLKFTGSYVAQKIVTTEEGKDGKGNPVQTEKTAYKFTYEPTLLTPDGDFPLIGSDILTAEINKNYLDFGPTYKKYYTAPDWPEAWKEYGKALSAATTQEKEFFLRINSTVEEAKVTPVEVKITAVTGIELQNFILKAQVYIPKVDKSGTPYKSYVTNMVFSPKVVNETPKTVTKEEVKHGITEVTTTVTHVLNVTWNSPEVTRG